MNTLEDKVVWGLVVVGLLTGALRQISIWVLPIPTIYGKALALGYALSCFAALGFLLIKRLGGSKLNANKLLLILTAASISLAVGTVVYFTTRPTVIEPAPGVGYLPISVTALCLENGSFISTQIKVNGVVYDVPEGGWLIVNASLPVTLEALPKDGFKVVGWTIFSTDTYNKTGAVIVESGRMFVANYSRDRGLVGPPENIVFAAKVVV